MPERSCILAVNCREEVQRVFREFFEKGGGIVYEVPSKEEAISSLQTTHFDLVCLCLESGDLETLNLVEEIHRGFTGLPIVILARPDQEHWLEERLHQDKGEILLSPKNPLRVLSAIREILFAQKQALKEQEIISEVTRLVDELQQAYGIEASQESTSESFSDQLEIRFLNRGPFHIDLIARRVELPGEMIRLPSTLFDYLATLARHAPQAVSFEALVKESLKPGQSAKDARRLARSQMHALRKAVEPVPERPVYVLAVRGFGYRLAA